MSTLVWIGSRGEDSAMFAAFGRTSAIVCCDWSAALESLSRDVAVHSLERSAGRRQLWSSASLPLLGRPLLRAGAAGQVWLPYRTGAWLELAGLPVAAPPAAVVDVLDDKLVQRQMFRDLGLRTPCWQRIDW